MDNRTREEKNEELFNLYPNVNVIYVTSDDRAFFSNERAHSHGQSLRNKDITPYKRPAGKSVKNLDDKMKVEQGGGSDELESLKAAYQELTGNKPHHAWKTVEKLQEKYDEKIAELVAEYTELKGEAPLEALSALGIRDAVEALKAGESDAGKAGTESAESGEGSGEGTESGEGSGEGAEEPKQD
tara:strand:+ start:179 stop:733 length:555 start_codon:yes stop_codon:yes gene_type:complete